MIKASLRVSARSHVHVPVMPAAKEMSRDSGENGENQTYSQTDCVDNHKRLILPSVRSKRAIEQPMQARKAFAPLIAGGSSDSVASRFIFLRQRNNRRGVGASTICTVLCKKEWHECQPIVSVQWTRFETF